MLFFTIKNNCVSDFAACVPERVLRKQEMLCAAFEFDGIDALLDCAAAYARILRGSGEHLLTRSELFTSGGRWRLLLCPARDLAAVRQFFGEFARFCGEDSFAAERTREHWRCVGDAQDTQCFERMGGICGRVLPKRQVKACFSPGNVYASVDS